MVTATVVTVRLPCDRTIFVFPCVSHSKHANFPHPVYFTPLAKGGGGGVK